jgi:hypothetical protein
MSSFKDNLYDLAYNMATRYRGKVAFWAIWNEPNLRYSFSPQDVNAGSGYLTNEYMVLIQFPAHDGITAVIPGAFFVGPDLFTPNGGGQVRTCDAFGHCMYLLGQGNWEDSMLRFFSNNFQTFTIHNYSDTDAGSRTAIGNTWSIMVSLGKQRQIWLDEFNFRNPCSYSEQTIVNYTRSLYTQMTNERAFYFSITDGFGAGSATCGSGTTNFGLLQAQAYNWAPKPVLYPGFQSIVSGH